MTDRHQDAIDCSNAIAIILEKYHCAFVSTYDETIEATIVEVLPCEQVQGCTTND